jgi:hypothetical protein
LVAVAEGVHRGQPDLEQLPGGGLDDVLDEHDPVAVYLGGAHHVPERGAGAVQGGGGHMPGGFEQRQLGAVLAAATGGGQLGADRECPQHVGVWQAAHVVVGDVGLHMLGVREIGRMSGDSFVPVVCCGPQLQASVL